MENNLKVKLIEGQFTNEEAKEIVMDVLNTKLNFHKIKTFSSKIRFGHEHEFSLKRIEELTYDLEKVKLFLENHKKFNTKLAVSSEIKITVLNE